jgi:hypothetical protein
MALVTIVGSDILRNEVSRSDDRSRHELWEERDKEGIVENAFDRFEFASVYVLSYS